VGHWRDRLPLAKRRIYDRSNRITSVPLRPAPGLLRCVQALEAALARGDRREVGQFSQDIANGVCASLEVPALRVLVQGRRPSSESGELHGLYTPGEASRRDTVKVWMITAKRGQVVAFRTFLRTLVHEICHHLDYELFDLKDSLHTEGFYTRESSLVRRLIDGSANGDRAPQPGIRSARSTRRTRSAFGTTRW
jgi:hypothetical protein